MNESSGSFSRLDRTGETLTAESLAGTSTTALDRVEINGMLVRTYKVILKGPGGTAIFQASPTVSESRQANYDGYNITHLPADMYAYRNTSGRRFSIQAKLVSRTVAEAKANARYFDLVRSWLLPDFGGTGATPPILKFSAFNNLNIKNLQVVLKSYNFSFPEEVDYIYGDNMSPMPIISTLGIEVDEIYSAEEIVDRKWKLRQSKGGFFEGEDGVGTPTPLLLAGGIASAVNAKASGISSIGSLLEKAQGVISNPIGALGKAINSTNLIDNIKASLPGVNKFVTGLSTSNIVSKGTNVSFSEIAQDLKTAQDSFKRPAPLPPPTIIGP